MTVPLNLGVFGGTFNPIHLGHLRVAEEAREALGLDRILFVPAKIPPHKNNRDIAPPGERLEWVRRAVEDNPVFQVSDLELEREGPSYSVHTLRQLRQQLADDGQLWFLLGMDAFREIQTWYRFSELFTLANIAVMRRPPSQSPLSPPQALAGQFEPTAVGYRHHSGRELRLLDVTLLDISSTQIRRAVSEGRSVRYLVPDATLGLLQRWGTRLPIGPAGS